jgi:hypothetical protein
MSSAMRSQAMGWYTGLGIFQIHCNAPNRHRAGEHVVDHHRRDGAASPNAVASSASAMPRGPRLQWSREHHLAADTSSDAFEPRRDALLDAFDIATIGGAGEFGFHGTDQKGNAGTCCCRRRGVVDHVERLEIAGLAKRPNMRSHGV